VIRIDVHPARETRPTHHAHPTLSPHMVLDHTYLTRSMHSNLSRVADIFGRIHYSGEKGIPDYILSTLTNRSTGPHLVSLPHSTKEVVSLRQASVDSKLLGLRGPHLWHVIGMFNTWSWGPTHQSLTDTGGGYNHLRAPPDLRISNLYISL
jgi:hypothetical protein